MNRRASRFGLLMACVLASATLLTMLGCGGGGGVATGCCTGWVHVSPEGDIVITGSRVPPEGYEPLEGAVVSIEGHPELTDTTDSNGQYLICCVPPGTQTIVVTYDGKEARFQVVIRPGRVTVGGGHSEGGGGF